jgi:hypothetical protein
MSLSLWVIVAAAVVLAALAFGFLRAWLGFRGKRVITCPENHLPAGVSLNAGHAALSSMGGKADLRLSECSRWPERSGCGQQCLGQIVEAPGDCLVRNIVAHWYEGKKCVWCGSPLDATHWTERKPALLSADRVSRAWNEVAAEKLPETLQTALPLCFPCHTANTFVREHPELTLDRSRPKE